MPSDQHPGRRYVQITSCFITSETRHLGPAVAPRTAPPGVKVLHVIPVPFPSVWHEDSDDASAIDLPTVTSLGRSLRCWVAEYLHLASLLTVSGPVCGAQGQGRLDGRCGESGCD